MESGSIEYPGSPTFSFGQQLIAAGPYITNINTTVGSDGMKTTYRMEVWTPRYGKLSKSFTDRAVKIAQTQNSIRRRLRGRVSAKFSAAQNRYLGIKKSRAVAANSTHPIIAGGSVPDTYKYTTMVSGSNGEPSGVENTKLVHKQSLAMIPHYGLQTNLGEDYKNKGAMSLDGIFRVFSTKEGTRSLPHFEYTDASGESDINSNTLNPFVNTDIQYLLSGDEPKEDISSSGIDARNARGLALRGPLIVAGWGYDTEGSPVPSSGDGTFLPGYKYDTAKWKCGPVDLRWDDDNKVWSAGGGGGAGKIHCVDYTGSGVKIDNKNYTLSNCIGLTICSGQKILVSKQNSNTALLVNAITCVSGQKPVCISVVTDITCDSGGNLVVNKSEICFTGTVTKNSGVIF